MQTFQTAFSVSLHYRSAPQNVQDSKWLIRCSELRPAPRRLCGTSAAPLACPASLPRLSHTAAFPSNAVALRLGDTPPALAPPLSCGTWCHWIRLCRRRCSRSRRWPRATTLTLRRTRLAKFGHAARVSASSSVTGCFQLHRIVNSAGILLLFSTSDLSQCYTSMDLATAPEDAAIAAFPSTPLPSAWAIRRRQQRRR